MVADHRLHNCEAQAGSLRLGGVIGGEESHGFFRGHAIACVGNFDVNLSILGGSSQYKSTAIRHGV